MSNLLNQSWGKNSKIKHLKLEYNNIIFHICDDLGKKMKKLDVKVTALFILFFRFNQKLQCPPPHQK